MPQRSRKMSDRELAAVIDDQIHDSILYNRSDLAELRRKALLYFEGDEALAGDVIPREKRSRVVSRDLSDVHGWIMPSLLRVFLSGERVVEYQPRRPDAEDAAKQATDYVNYVFLSECDGYAVLHSGFWDGLTFGNGIVKHWWDDAPEYKTESLSGITEVAYLELANDPDVEILEHTARDDPNDDAVADAGGMDSPLAGAAGGATALGGAPAGADQDGAAGAPGGVLGSAPQPPLQPAPATDGAVVADGAEPPGAVAGAPVAPADLGGFGAPQLHDLKIKRTTSNGCFRIAAVPPEEFRIDRNATRLDEKHARFAAHISPRTRSSLVEDGYPRKIVDELPANRTTIIETPEGVARDRRIAVGDNAPDRSTDLIEVWECYVQLDYDGDGIAEWRRVVTADGDSERQILANEEWDDDLPFSDIVPDPMPHRWRGGSLYEEVADLQRIKTVMWRGINDNLYWHNDPMYEAVETSVNQQGLDRLENPEFGAVIYTKALGSVAPLPIPFVADKLVAGLELADQIREFRTGVSSATMALDPEALANQTATAVNASQTAGYSKVETYARNIAEYRGLKRIFECALRLIVKHQDRSRMIRLRGEWVEMDPRSWDADMDVVINVGLGSGSRDRDLTMLQAVAAKQELVTQGLGPVVAAQLGLGPDKIFATYRKMVEAAGLKSPESYFPEITADQVQQIIRQMGSQQQPSPEMMQAQAKIQIMQQESQARIQLIAAQAAQVQAQTGALGIKSQGEAAKTQSDMQRGMLGMEHDRAQIENLRAAALANMAKAGATQSDAQINQQLASLEALDHLVSWHQQQQQLHHDAIGKAVAMHQDQQKIDQQQEQMRQRVKTPGVDA